MLSSGKYKSNLKLEAKYDIFHEILSTFNRKMDFYFTTSPSSFLCFQITWKQSSFIFPNPNGPTESNAEYFNLNIHTPLICELNVAFNVFIIFMCDSHVLGASQVADPNKT